MNEEQRKNLKEWNKLSNNMHNAGRSWGLGNLVVGLVVIVILILIYFFN